MHNECSCAAADLCLFQLTSTCHEGQGAKQVTAGGLTNVLLFVCGAQASKAFFDAERRYNYTTPKSFLEVIKLYKNVLARKRRESQEAIDRLENGLSKLHKTQGEVDVLMDNARKMAIEVEQKVASANVFAEQVGEGQCLLLQSKVPRWDMSNLLEALEVISMHMYACQTGLHVHLHHPGMALWFGPDR